MRILNLGIDIMNRRMFLKAMGVLLAASAMLDISSVNAAGKEMNVLFIPVDDLNHWIGYTGRNKQAKTPNIDRLSKMGVSFTNAHCAAPACEPTRASLWSGMRPSTSGCYLNSHTWQKYIPEGISLNATFKKNGYYVFGTGKTYHHTGPSVYLSEWSEYAPRFEGPKVTAGEGFHVPVSVELKDDDLWDWHSVNYCIEQLQRKHDTPFFLACGLIKPHLPWAVPRKYYDMFPLEDIELPPLMKKDLADIPEIGRNIGITKDHPKFLASGRWKNAIQAYLATIAYVDMCIGRLLDALEKSEYKDNTIVVLWGDHGWHLGEKEHWRKFTLWEEATRAPMIWYVPGVTKADSICDRSVDFMSMYPTLCELAGLEKPGHVEGDSIVKLLKDPNAKWDGVAITTHGFMNHAVRTEKWRYIKYSDGSEELYDHSKDEYEWTNLANEPKYASVIKELATHLPKKNAPNTPLDVRKKKKTKK